MIVERPYGQSTRSELLALAGHVEARAELWDWRFAAQVQAKSYEPLVLCDEATGTVVGFNGVTSVRVRCRGQTLRGAWSCDFGFHQSWRRQVADRAGTILRQRYPLLLGFVAPGALADQRDPLWCSSTETVQCWLGSEEAGLSSVLRRLAQRLNCFWAHLIVGRTRASTLCTRVSRDLPDADAVDTLWELLAPTYPNIVCRA